MADNYFLTYIMKRDNRLLNIHHSYPKCLLGNTDVLGGSAAGAAPHTHTHTRSGCPTPAPENQGGFQRIETLCEVHPAGRWEGKKQEIMGFKLGIVSTVLLFKQHHLWREAGEGIDHNEWHCDTCSLKDLWNTMSGHLRMPRWEVGGQL